jgi:hypothetical protein
MEKLSKLRFIFVIDIIRLIVKKKQIVIINIHKYR